MLCWLLLFFCARPFVFVTSFFGVPLFESLLCVCLAVVNCRKFLYRQHFFPGYIIFSEILVALGKLAVLKFWNLCSFRGGQAPGNKVSEMFVGMLVAIKFSNFLVYARGNKISEILVSEAKPQKEALRQEHIRF